MDSSTLEQCIKEQERLSEWTLVSASSLRPGPPTRKHTMLSSKSTFLFPIQGILYDSQKLRNDALHAALRAMCLDHVPKRLNSTDLTRKYESLSRVMIMKDVKEREVMGRKFLAILKAEDGKSLCTKEGVEKYLDTYDEHLRIGAVSSPKGAVELIRSLHALGKKILLYGNEPAELQDLVIERLGVMAFIDKVGHMRTDSERTFQVIYKILRKMEVAKGEEICVVGCELEMDIKPALQCGLLAVLYHEKGRDGLKDVECEGKAKDGTNCISVNDLVKLKEAIQ